MNDQTVQLLRESSLLDPQIMSASVSNRNMDEFCLSIPFAAAAAAAAAATDSSDSSSSSDDDDDSDVEVVFTRDEQQDDLVPINDLRLQSDDSDDDDCAMTNESAAASPHDVCASAASVSAESPSASNASSAAKSGDNPSQKRKRRAWSVREKLRAIENYEASNSKHSTARAVGCTRFQLSEWLKQKDELKSLRSTKRGKRMNVESVSTSTDSFLRRWSTEETEGCWHEDPVSDSGRTVNPMVQGAAYSSRLRRHTERSSTRTDLIQTVSATRQQPIDRTGTRRTIHQMVSAVPHKTWPLVATPEKKSEDTT